MPEEHEKAGKLDEAEEVFDVVFPSRHQAAEVLHPGKEALYFPAVAIAAQRAAKAVVACGPLLQLPASMADAAAC
jgi:hypothetical protein